MKTPVVAPRGWWLCAGPDRVAVRTHYYRAGLPLCGAALTPERPMVVATDKVKPVSAPKCRECDRLHLAMWCGRAAT